MEQVPRDEGAVESGLQWPYEEPSPTRSEQGTHLRVLDGIVHAFASATHAEEAFSGTARWIREAVGDREATIRILLPDGSGRLRVRFADGASRTGLRTPQAPREDVFRTKRPSVAAVRTSGSTLVRLPLVTRGEAVGLVEVVTARGVDGAMPTLVAVTSQAAIALDNIRQRTELAREVAVRGTLTALSRRLMGLRSREAAAETAVAFCAEHLDVPAAAWFFKGDERGMELLAAEGVEHARAQALHRRMAWIPRWDTLPSGKRGELVALFAELTGAEDVSPVSAGDVLFFGAGPRSGLLAVVEGLLEDILAQLASVARAQRRNDQLDIALAWTAHEFRGPLVGVKAMVEQLLEDGGEPSAHRRSLQDLYAELDELTGLVEPVLQWAAGAVPLQRRRTDVVAVVREAAGATGPEGDRIGIAGVGEAFARVDPGHLRTAISNVIRNAMAYSPQGSTVAVTVTADREALTISVADRGPGVPASERETIFDPFMRGQIGQTTRFGKGLGLFIARRVVEAHEGKIWVESPGGEGAVFHLSLPLA